MIKNIRVVLFKPKYSENVGSAARACLNMGISDMVLVDPPKFEMERALPLATAHAKSLLESARMTDTLEQALEGCTSAYGTTARTGGWRKGIMGPSKCAEVVVEKLSTGGKVAIVFGPEDRGLTNEETSACTGLVRIPTSIDGTSLNLSQAVLIMVYECFKLTLEKDHHLGGPPLERPATVAEQETLFANIQESLVAIDFIRQDNADYWMLPMRRFMSRLTLKRNEFNLLMGICRQIKWISNRR